MPVIERVEVLALVVSVALLATVLELVRRRKLLEEYSFGWIAAGLVLIAVSARRSLLDTAAHWLGVYYPPAVLLIVLVPIVFGVLLGYSVVVSRHRRQIDRLIEDTAVLAAELRELRAERRSALESRDPSDLQSSSPEPKRPVM
jgi:hypothetical protein